MPVPVLGSDCCTGRDVPPGGGVHPALPQSSPANGGLVSVPH